MLRVFLPEPRRRRSLNYRRHPLVALASLQGLHRKGPARSPQGETELSLSRVSFPSAHTEEWIRLTRAFLTRHLPPSEFETPVAAFSPSRLPPVFQSGALVGFTLQGFLTSRVAASPFGDRCLHGVSRATDTVLGRWIDGTAYHLGPWHPWLQAARPPSRLCSTREPVSIAKRLSLAMGRNPLGFHPP